ncbi:C45 family autoproteolytic acyltransferase/hydolase [Deinococcus hopiensis]|uniref:Penicillin V acylase and related amidases n=1 Tax=Deinococcus hopiensis KR-140 TaxID=695939 RepID=A0A1W1UJQ0_9DEIO|nr:C45 family autoproteolytic acyltransferase/hydolase [Deinococcus hopiensis]SMB81297.1 Penicillin V acylase and related amidases [Deinococcus hopiensis KR-140]
MLPDLYVNLEERASRRWHLPPEHVVYARALTHAYIQDFGGEATAGLVAESFASTLTEDEHAEAASLAAQIGLPVPFLLFGTLYYDAIKAALACTAFAVPTPDGPLHARNLDWWTEGGLLTTGSVITHFTRGGRTHFSTVGWPGFFGALSGVAPGRFSVTLNAVSSADPPLLARPVVLLLRQVLDEVETYDEAVRILASVPIAADCLLLVTGVRNEEMTVIERSPTRSAVRGPERGILAVANDYLALTNAEKVERPDGLHVTSSGRYACALQHLANHVPRNADACFQVLQAPDVRMGITVQHMVLQASTGQVQLRLP